MNTNVQIHNLSSMSLAQIAQLVGVPSIVKMSKEKAIARAVKELDKRQPDNVSARYETKAMKTVQAVAESLKADKAKPAVPKGVKIPDSVKAPAKVKASKTKEPKTRAPNRYALLTEILTHAPATIEELCERLGKEKTVRKTLSNIKNPKWASAAGVEVLMTKLIDGKYTVVSA